MLETRSDVRILGHIISLEDFETEWQSCYPSELNWGTEPHVITKYDNYIGIKAASGSLWSQSSLAKNVETGSPLLNEQSSITLKLLASFDAAWTSGNQGTCFVGLTTPLYIAASNGVDMDNVWYRTAVRFGLVNNAIYNNQYDFRVQVILSPSKDISINTMRTNARFDVSTVVYEEIIPNVSFFYPHLFELTLYYSKTAGSDIKGMNFVFKIDGQPILMPADVFKSSDPEEYDFTQGCGVILETCNYWNYVQCSAHMGLCLYSLEVTS